MKNRNKYFREYRKKHPELKEYNKLWMRAFRNKTKKPKLNIISQPETRKVPEFYGKNKCARCGIKIGVKYFYKKGFIYNEKEVCEDCYEKLSTVSV